MKHSLRIASGLDLPLDAVTQKLAWLGRTGSGKTYGCKRMVEQMLRAGAQVIILDGAGVWAGLRLGKKSFDVPVLGGLYGDIPLESTAGALVADVIVDRGINMVLDVSQMLDAERTRFATAFAQRFFQRKKAAPSAVHLVLEECQDYVPQNFQTGEEKMLHEFVRLAKQGRSLGIGLSFLSQRPQEINKKALNQTECVFAFQMTGPQERKALEYWLNDKGFEGKLSEILPRLEVGAPHVWSPQWLKISKIVRILPIDSLDTSQTPKVGGKTFAHKKLGSIDLKALTTAMAETVERTKADDPKELRKKIVELEKELAKKTSAVVVVAKAATTKLDQFEVVVDRRHLVDTISASEEFEADVLAFEKMLGGMKQALDRIHSSANCTAKAARRARDTGPAALSKRLEKAGPAPKTRTAPPPLAGAHHYGPRGAKATTSGHIDTSLPKGERAIMIAIAQHPNGVTREQLTILTGYKRSTRDAYLQRLSTSGHVDTTNGMIEATADGRHALGFDYQPLPTGHALLEHWLGRLPEGERKILEVAAERFPEAVSRDWIGERTGYKRSTRDAYLQRLGTRKLVKTDRDGVQLSEELVG
jgi:hypothetical protein